MRALILNDEIRGWIKRVVGNARESPVSLSLVKEMMAGKAPPVGDDPRFVCMIPVGYRVVFSIEQHPGGWMRHLSISVPGGRLPHQAACEEIMREFGFAGGVEECEQWVEELEEVRAVNLVQPVERIKRGRD